jgi:imidazolonepropionase-like amidohydrolase
MQKLIYIGIIILISVGLHGQQIAKGTYKTVLLENAEIYTVTQGVVQGSLLIQDGVIAGVGRITDVPADAEKIDCTGKRIYPGFIDAGCQLGLSEISSVSLTNDTREIGDFTPHMKALTAVNPSSVSIPVTRTNGVTTVLTKPSGGTFPGQAALIDLWGYTPDQMYAGFQAPLLRFPSTGKRGRRDRRSEEDIKKDADKATKKLNEIWDKAILYTRIDSNRVASNKEKAKYNPQMDALVPVVKGEENLLVEVNSKNDILLAISWVRKYDIHTIFTGVAEGWRVADSLAKYNIPVVTGPMLSTPSRTSDPYNIAYANASKMQQAGVKVAIRTNDTENVRNLPFNAGFAATYGMGTEEALKAITINTAEIFGVADKYGSLEKGKIANLFVCDGDPFEMKTKISHLFIKGWNVPMENRHTLLYEEYLERSPGLDK